MYYILLSYVVVGAFVIWVLIIFGKWGSENTILGEFFFMVFWGGILLAVISVLGGSSIACKVWLTFFIAFLIFGNEVRSA